MFTLNAHKYAFAFGLSLIVISAAGLARAAEPMRSPANAVDATKSDSLDIHAMDYNMPVQGPIRTRYRVGVGMVDDNDAAKLASSPTTQYLPYAR